MHMDLGMEHMLASSRPVTCRGLHKDIYKWSLVGRHLVRYCRTWFLSKHHVSYICDKSLDGRIPIQGMSGPVHKIIEWTNCSRWKLIIALPIWYSSIWRMYHVYECPVRLKWSAFNCCGVIAWLSPDVSEGKIKPRMNVSSSTGSRINGHAPLFFDSITEGVWVWIQPHYPRLAILPVRGIPRLAPVNDRCHFRIRPRCQDGVGSEEITMCEHNGYFTSDFDSTSTVKLLDGVLTLE